MGRPLLILAALAVVLAGLVAVAASGVLDRRETGGDGPRPTAITPPIPTLAASPDSSPDPGGPPADPRLAWAEFVLRAAADGAAIADLNGRLERALEADDAIGALDAADAIHDFAIAELAWLADHPPATCYRAAHTAADAMLAAYDEAAAQAGRWASATAGFARVQALAAAVEASRAASDAFEDLETAMAAQTCLAGPAAAEAP